MPCLYNVKVAKGSVGTRHCRVHAAHTHTRNFISRCTLNQRVCFIACEKARLTLFSCITFFTVCYQDILILNWAASTAQTRYTRLGN